MRKSNTTRFNEHSRLRLAQRSDLSEGDAIVTIRNNNYHVKMGNEKVQKPGRKVPSFFIAVRKLFYSNIDGTWYVIFQDRNTKTIITILWLWQHERTNAWPVSRKKLRKALDRAKPQLLLTYSGPTLQ